jgi:phosphate transport system permease protein
VSDAVFVPQLHRRRALGHLFAGGCLVLTVGALTVLAVLLLRVVSVGWALVTRQFIESFPSVMNPETGGVRSPLWGSIWLIGLTTFIAVPVGVSAAVYLQEYARPSRLTRLIQLNIANLAGVPSIVYGILGLAVFIRWMHLGRSLLAGALTMALLILPVIIIATREALAAVPDSIRQAAYAVGATRWQVVRHHVLPGALPGIMTGVILALSRAIGEAAPLLMIGALTFVQSVPHYPTPDRLDLLHAPLRPFSALPLQIYNWSSQPQEVFHRLAAAGIIVLLALLLSMNALAIWIRSRQQRVRAW